MTKFLLVLKWIFAIIALTAFIGFGVAGIMFLRKAGKSIVLIPKFKIISVKNTSSVSGLVDSVRIGKEIVERIVE